MGERNNSWLHPFKNPNMWYRAYHGTGNAKKEGFGPLDAASNIKKEGFRMAQKQVHGAGVYCSPHPRYVERLYASQHTIETIQEDGSSKEKTYKMMLQVAVDPNGVKKATNDIWVAHDKRYIKCYRILIKEV